MEEAKFSPIFFLAICYILGVVLADLVRISFWIPAAALGLCIALLVFSLRYSFSFGFLLPYASFFLIGLILASFTVRSLQESLLLKLAKEEAYIVAYGEVGSEPKIKGKRLDFTLKAEEVKHRGKLWKTSGLAKVVIEEKQGTKKVKMGDKIKIKGVLCLPRNFSNSSQFDYKNYLYRRKIQTVLTSNSEHLKIVQSGNNFTCNQLHFARDAIRKNAFRALGRNKGALLMAIIIGEKEALSEDVVDDFRDSGLAHVLVVSGLHVGLLAMALWSFLKWLG